LGFLFFLFILEGDEGCPMDMIESRI